MYELYVLSTHCIHCTVQMIILSIICTRREASAEHHILILLLVQFLSTNDTISFPLMMPPQKRFFLFLLGCNILKLSCFIRLTSL